MGKIDTKLYSEFFRGWGIVMVAWLISLFVYVITSTNLSPENWKILSYTNFLTVGLTILITINFIKNIYLKNFSALLKYSKQITYGILIFPIGFGLASIYYLSGFVIDNLSGEKYYEGECKIQSIYKSGSGVGESGIRTNYLVFDNKKLPANIDINLLKDYSTEKVFENAPEGQSEKEWNCSQNVRIIYLDHSNVILDTVIIHN